MKVKLNFSELTALDGGGRITGVEQVGNYLFGYYSDRPVLGTDPDRFLIGWDVRLPFPKTIAEVPMVCVSGGVSIASARELLKSFLLDVAIRTP